MDPTSEPGPPAANPQGSQSTPQLPAATTPSKPRGPRSPWAFFSADKRPAVKAANPDKSAADVMKLLGQMWKGASDDEKAKAKAEAKEDQERYKSEMKAWEEEVGEEALKALKKKEEADKIAAKKRKASTKVDRDHAASILLREDFEQRMKKLKEEATQGTMLTRAGESRGGITAGEMSSPWFNPVEMVYVEGHGYGRVVDCTGSGVGSVTSVALIRGPGDAPFRPPPGCDQRLHALTELGKLIENVPFNLITRKEYEPPRPQPRAAAAAARGKMQCAEEVEEEGGGLSPRGKLVEKLKGGLKKQKGWLRKKLNLSAGRKQLSPAEKNLFLGHHSLIAGGPAQERGESGEFAATFPAKHELSRAWGVSRSYMTDLKRQLRGAEAFSDAQKKKKRRISVIDDPQLAARVYTGEREYSSSAQADEDAGRTPYDELGEDDKKAWGAKARERASKQVTAREEIVRLLKKNGAYSFQMLANELKFCGKEAVRRWFHSFPTSEVYPERVIPLISKEQQSKHLQFARHFTNRWGLREQKILLVHYDEKWFWGLVLRRNAKACEELGVSRQDFKAYHKSHINKVMGIAAVGAAFNGSLNNGCEGVKIAFTRAQVSKIAQRRVEGVRERGALFNVDVAVTGSSLGTPDDPKFPLKDFFETVVFENISKLVDPGGRYEGYTVVIQGDNAGPHECGVFQKYVKEYCNGRGWHWEPQAPQMPHANVCDLSVFPGISKHHTRLSRNIGGLKVISEDETWDAAKGVFEEYSSEKIARGFVHCQKILEEVVKQQGRNDFLGSSGSIHFGVRKGFEATDYGVKPR